MTCLQADMQACSQQADMQPAGRHADMQPEGRLAASRHARREMLLELLLLRVSSTVPVLSHP